MRTSRLFLARVHILILHSCVHLLGPCFSEMLTSSIPAHVRHVSGHSNLLEIKNQVKGSLLFCWFHFIISRTWRWYGDGVDKGNPLPASLLCANKLLLVTIITLIIFNRIVNCHGNWQSISSPSAPWHFQLAQKCSLN